MNALKSELDAHKTQRRPEKTEFHSYIESVSGAVNICLGPSGWKDISYSLSREELVAHHDQHGELPVEMLSDGIRNMIGMVADIAFRATKLNPQLGSGAAQGTPGIVLIDEVDMHLHPAWQQVVLQGLLSAFPRMQFIVTTHSPQVLSTVPSQSIRILDLRWNDELQKYQSIVVKQEMQTEGIPSADVLARPCAF
jgi:predicted ATP-binding protein involved in virulence